MHSRRSRQSVRARHGRGQGAVEYAIAVSLVALVVIASVVLVGRATRSSLAQIGAGLSGSNLVVNGYGQLGNNTGFSAFTFDSVNKPPGNVSGSFMTAAVRAGPQADPFIPVNIDQTYTMSLDAMSGEAGGANFNPGNLQYAGLIPYDIDGNLVDATNYTRKSGSTNTTLSAALLHGATTMTLADATGWQAAGPYYERQILWWPYADSKGTAYPPYTYSRNLSLRLGAYASAGLWAAGGISGNTITLSAPWPATAPELPAGTPVQDPTAGGYKYVAIGGLPVPNAWTHYGGTIGGVDTTASQAVNLFPYGTTKIRVLLLSNYPPADYVAMPNTIRIANVSFG